MSTRLFVSSVTIGGSAPVGNVPGVGGKTYNFKTSYAAGKVAGQTGVTTILKKDWGHDEPLIPIAELERSGKVVRVVAPYTADVAHVGKVKYLEMVIDRGKLSTIEVKDALKNQPVVTATVTGDETTIGYFVGGAYLKRRSILLV